MNAWFVMSYDACCHANVHTGGSSEVVRGGGGERGKERGAHKEKTPVMEEEEEEEEGEKARSPSDNVGLSSFSFLSRFSMSLAVMLV